MTKLILYFVISLNLIVAQSQFSGQVKLVHSSFLNDCRTISKPFRIGALDFYYTFANIDLTFKNAIEYNWVTSKSKYDYRELYISWYPKFGELRLGKQIIPLGMADGNNPTDNINPYNYNYLFSSGIDRKEAVNSLYSDIYYDDFQFNVILKWDNSGNVFPQDNEDSIFPNINLVERNKTIEYGISLIMMLNENDISFTFQNLLDHTPTFNNNNLSYRNTHMYGFNTVGFINDIIYRLETGYFITKYNNITQGEYIQVTSQLEYETNNNSILMIQYIRQDILYNKFDDFTVALGNPLLSILNNSLLLSSKNRLMDEYLSIDTNAIINLENKLHSININLKFEILNDLNIEYTISKFFNADSRDIIYEHIEDFSQSIISIQYSY